MNLLVLLQATAEVATNTTTQHSVNYLTLVMKGGWILLPIFLLSIISIYVIIDRYLVINRLGKKDTIWLSRVMELIYENKIDKAMKFSLERPYASGKIIAAGLKEYDSSNTEIEATMELEARQQIAQLEHQMNYLGITASIAPMLGFLGTIFGVIHIFYNISLTNDLNISTISDGLYQKMICSGAGLFVGIIAYSGYYLLNGRIDKIVVDMDRNANEAIKAIKACKNGQSINTKEEAE